MLAHQALVRGEIDLYPEYTGTALTTILKLPPAGDPAAAIALVRGEYQTRFGLEWMDPLGFNNTFAMVIRGEDARKNKIATLSDAARHAPGWNLGVGYEFQQRPDGLAGLLKTYHLPIHGSPKTMDLGLLYKALEQGQVSMVAGNATDGQLSVLDALVLQDDQRYFPPYDCGLVVRAEILKDQSSLAASPRRTGWTVHRPDHAQVELSGGRRTSPRTGGGGAVLTGSRSASLNRRSIDFRQRPIPYRSIALRRGIPSVERDQESPRRGICGRLPSRSFPLL